MTGGYFRARINGISPFDKILGGLAWAISACNVDVDIDVFQVCSFFFHITKMIESAQQKHMNGTYTNRKLQHWDKS